MSNAVNNHAATLVPITEEAGKPESPKPRRLSIIREFALNTSTHGLPGIARSQNKHNRIFWTISFLIFTGITIFFITESIEAYFNYPTQTSVSIVVERSQAFPAVTFCNYAPVRYDRIIGPFLNYTNSLNLTNTNDTSIFTVQQASVFGNYLRQMFNAGDPVDAYFFSLDIMLINCSYNDKACTANDFISFLSSTYGRCFTFNAKTKDGNGTAVRYNTDNGGPGKLQLRLYAQSHLYVPYVSQDVSAGIVAMIHDNTELPQIDVAGIELAPGQKHKLGYQKRAAYFLSSPYTDCTEKIPLVMQAMFNRYEGADYGYSQSICYTLCAQAYVYQECGCVSPTEWSAQSVVLPGTNTIIEAPLCDPNSACYLDAASRLSNTTSIQDEFCSDCTQECSTIEFSVTPSSVSAPSLQYVNISKGFVESVSVPLPIDWSTNWRSEVQNNYVSIDVVCESLVVENYTQQASISIGDVFSNIGGQTGLWIGISFLSIMEFIEMIYRIMRYECHAIRKTIKKRLRKNNN